MGDQKILDQALASIVSHYHTMMILNLTSGELHEICEGVQGLEVKEKHYIKGNDEAFIIPEMEDIYPDDVNRVKQLVTFENIRSARDSEIPELIEVFRKCKGNNGRYEWYELRLTIPKKEQEDIVVMTVHNLSRNMDNNPNIKAVEEIVNAAGIEKNNFLLKISQELQTPLNHIIGITNMLQKPGDKKTETSYKKEIEDSARFIKKAMDNILEMSMYTNHGKTVTYSKLKLDEMFQWLEAVFRPMAEQKKIKLEFVTTTACSNYLMLDREKCMLVYYNLIMNALDYTPAGGTISIKTREVYQRDNTVFIRSVIRDTGIGISQEYQQKMFDAYDSAKGADFVDVGLGMTIVKNYLHLMNGAIHAESKHSKGTTVTVAYTAEIPQEASGKKQMKEPVIRSLDITGRKILLIEDNEINRNVTKNVLQKAGAEVLEASDGSEAMEQFCQCDDGELSIIVSDIMMPQVNGLEVAAKIRQLDRKDAKTIPIIAVTANTFDEDVSRIFAYGMDAFVPKPIQKGIIFGVIDEVLNG